VSVRFDERNFPRSAFGDLAVKKLWAVTAALALGCVFGCSHASDPQSVLDHAASSLLHGNVTEARDEAEKGYARFHRLSPEWAWKFTILRGRILFWTGRNDEALKILADEPSPPCCDDLAVQKLRLEGVVHSSLHKFPEAKREITEAQRICETSDYPACSDMNSTLGKFEMDQEHYATGEQFFTRALVSARSRGNQFVEASSLLDLSWAADQQTHFDEALDWAILASKLSKTENFPDIAQAALGDMAWAYYKLGNLEQAEGMFVEASNQAHSLSDASDEASWLTNAGYVQKDQGNIPEAQQYFLKSETLARSVNSREDISDALVALALVSVQTGSLDDAVRYNNEALSMARQDQSKSDEDFARLVQGQIAAKQHDSATAEAAFHEVERSDASPAYLKWDAQHSLAQLYEEVNQTEAKDEYRTAIGTFESARCDLKHESSKLAFLNNAASIYDDYIHFLVTQGKTDEALQVAEHERGRTLLEGLGLPDTEVSKAVPEKSCTSEPEPSQSGSSKTNVSQKATFKSGVVDPQATARRAGGTILFYALGEKQSYLWAISPQKTSFFKLPPKSEIDPTVQRYGKVLANHQEFAAGKDAQTLYQTLVAPAQAMLPKDTTVFIIPDGSLNILNFETLQVDETNDPQPHYWIEDATIADASSLRMLGASHSARPQRLKPQLQEVTSGTAGSRALPNADQPRKALPQHTGRLLLMGDAVAPSADYPELREASVEMENIKKHFPKDRQQVFDRERATPTAYLESKPDQFSYIHFVAHGTASRTSPLDSAIILSSVVEQEDSFKLYARDIVPKKLNAQLVTISTCYGAGTRAYSGEGLVGLSWAFLRAGSHNVIGALWAVSDESTPPLMDSLYDGLTKGQSPNSALRAAKLSLLHSTRFSKPFYWAPFQLYTGL
jgi:CHAT domain-containing protein